MKFCWFYVSGDMNEDRVIYSTSVDNAVILVCNWGWPNYGQLANILLYPVQKFAVSVLIAVSCLFHFFAWDASTHQSNVVSVNGMRVIPLSFVVRKYHLMFCFWMGTKSSALIWIIYQFWTCGFLSRWLSSHMMLHMWKDLSTGQPPIFAWRITDDNIGTHKKPIQK